MGKMKKIGVCMAAVAGVAGLAGSALWAEAFHADLYGDSKKGCESRSSTVPLSQPPYHPFLI